MYTVCSTTTALFCDSGFSVQSEGDLSSGKMTLKAITVGNYSIVYLRKSSMKILLKQNEHLKLNKKYTHIDITDIIWYTQHN